MPRSGPSTYLYTLPAIYLAIPGTTIITAQHNDPLEDIADTFNSIQPVVWGGTGSGNAAGARANLGLTIGTNIPGFASNNVWTGTQDFQAAVTFSSTDAGAAEAPVLTAYRNSASPAASDLIGELLFVGRDSAANVQSYAAILAQITDPTSTSEDAVLLLQTIVAGTLTTRFKVGAGFFSLNATGGDKGVDTVNTKGYYVDNVVVYPGIMADTTPGAAQAATQAQQETATSTAVVVTPARQQFHPSAAKCWGMTTGGGSPSLAASYNVSSITDAGSGLLTVNLTTSFSSSSYAAVASNVKTNQTNTYIAAIISPGTGSFQIDCKSDSNATTDPPTGWTWMCGGDQ